MKQGASDQTWTYDSVNDVWISADDAITLDGSVVRQLARQCLRARRQRALKSLETAYRRAPGIERAYRQALVEILRGDWALPLAS
ncbi:MAG TPA: hypothetical protein VFC51_16580 [Chloroflexota bacterium]|nr:hypothetical protein [Chloroflexota bacterium]